MSLLPWLLCLAVCVLFGSKAVAAIRHYCIEENDDKSSVKVIDLCMAFIVGLIPIINFVAAIVGLVIFLATIFLECIEFKKGFLNKNLFGGDDD